MKIIKKIRGEDSQGKFAKKVGVNQGTISKMELGIMKPGFQFLKGLLKYRGIEAVEKVLRGR